MVGKTGRKCASQGMNVIAGGSQPMSNLYNASLSPHSRKIATQAPLFIPRIPSAKPLEATSRTGSSWYSGLENLKFLRKKELGFLIGLEKNRIVSEREHEYVPVEGLQLPEGGKVVHLRKFGFVTVFRTLDKNHEL